MTGTQQIAVWPSLAPYVVRIEIEDVGLASVIDAELPPPVLPTPYPMLGFQYRGRLAVLRSHVRAQSAAERLLDRSGITLLQRTARQFRPHDGARSVLVTLSPTAAYALTGWPMHELADDHVGLGSLLPSREVRALEDALADVESADACGDVVQRHLLRLFRRSVVAPHPVIAEAVRRLVGSGGQQRVHTLAADLGIGERQLERLFRQQIGAGPKAFGSLVQFDRALRRLLRGASLSALALDAGYADQAHFTSAFAERAGQTPAQFLATLPSSLSS